jgi:hypothetical protein
MSTTSSANSPLANSSTPPSTTTMPAAPPQAATSIQTSTAATATSLVNFKVSLSVPLMKSEQLYPTPSMKENLPFEVEFDLRLTGCELIQTAGRLLKLPQVSIVFLIYSFAYINIPRSHNLIYSKTAMATGQVIFHRFYYTKSFVRNPMEVKYASIFFNPIFLIIFNNNFFYL